MTINPSKTVYMTIGTHRKLSKRIELSLSVQGTTLQSVEIHRLLGIHLDKALTWDIHINTLCKQVNIKINLLKRISHFLTLDMKKVF